MTRWADVAANAPELAKTVQRQFESHLHHVIGTVRSDGAPRLSGTEVTFHGDDLTVGMMPGSQKLADVQRDPRVEIHSAPVDIELGVGDAKVAGRLVEIPPPDEDQPPGNFFRLDVELVSLVRVESDELVLTSWRPDRGVRQNRRT